MYYSIQYELETCSGLKYIHPQYKSIENMHYLSFMVQVQTGTYAEVGFKRELRRPRNVQEIK